MPVKLYKVFKTDEGLFSPPEQYFYGAAGDWTRGVLLEVKKDGEAVWIATMRVASYQNPSEPRRYEDDDEGVWSKRPKSVLWSEPGEVARNRSPATLALSLAAVVLDLGKDTAVWWRMSVPGAPRQALKQILCVVTMARERNFENENDVDYDSELEYLHAEERLPPSKQDDELWKRAPTPPPRVESRAKRVRE